MGENKMRLSGKIAGDTKGGIKRYGDYEGEKR